MSKEDLDNKIWYRALKVVFFLFFIIVFVFINLIVWEITSDKHISDNTFKQVGSIIKQAYPVYNNMSDVEVGKRVYEKSYDNWEKYTTTDPSLEYIPTKYPPEELPIGTTLSKEVLDKYYKLPKVLINYTYRPIWQRILYNILTSITLIVVFWLIAKVFFYITLGEKFFSLKNIRR